MASTAEELVAESFPPRRGAVVALAVDSTARPYDISTLVIGEPAAPEASLKQRKVVVLWMQAETNDVYFYFNSATANDLSDTATISAGSSMAYANTYCGVLKAGNPPVKFVIDRSLDKWLIVKAASTAGILRFWAGSEGR